MPDTPTTNVIVPPQSTEEKLAEKADIRTWRMVLVGGALAFVVLTIVFQVWSSIQTSSSTVTTTGTDATTKNGVVETTSKKGPPDTLVATCAGAAAALLVAAAFYNRIKKFSVAGIGVELEDGLTAPEVNAVVKAATKEADTNNLPDAKPAIVATALDDARGTKAMLRRGVTPDESIDSLELLRDPEALASYSALRAVAKFK